MPRIPTYEGPQVRSEALRPVYQRAPDLISGARQIAQALAAGAEMLDRRIERDAQDEAFKLELQVRTDYQRQRAALRDQYKGDQADQYGTAMAEIPAIDAATQAAWLSEHFDCEYGTEMEEA